LPTILNSHKIDSHKPHMASGKCIDISTQIPLEFFNCEYTDERFSTKLNDFDKDKKVWLQKSTFNLSQKSCPKLNANRGNSGQHKFRKRLRIL
jgi:hypothetical protein